MVLVLPLMCIKQIFPFSLISGLFVKATTYVGLVAMCFCICRLKADNKALMKRFLLYMCVLSISYIISFLYGYYTFDFPELLVTNVGKNAEAFLTIISGYGIDITRADYACVLLFFKAILKETIINNIILFGIAFYIACEFRNRWKVLIKLFNTAVMIIFVVSILYSIIEIGYIKGYRWPTEFIAAINPYLYHINTEGSVTWPPLLWGDRFRSIFPECSYCAIFISSVLPIYLLTLENDNEHSSTKNIMNYVLMFCVFFLLFATDSKTAMVLIGCLIVYIVGITMVNRSTFLYKGITILSCIVFSGLGYFVLIKTPYIIPAENPSVQSDVINSLGGVKKWNIGYNSIPQKQYKQQKHVENQTKDMEKYLEKNIYNVANVNYGSNSSRYGITFTELRVWTDYPIWGAGSGALMQPYMYSRFPKFSDNEEIRRWKKFNTENGVMTHHLPVLNHLSNQLARNGLVCFVLFYLPLLYLVYIVTYKKWARYSIKERNVVYALLMSLFCIFVSCMSASLNLLLTYWIVLGILGAVALSDDYNGEIISETKD